MPKVKVGDININYEIHGRGKLQRKAAKKMASISNDLDSVLAELDD